METLFSGVLGCVRASGLIGMKMAVLRYGICDVVVEFGMSVKRKHCLDRYVLLNVAVYVNVVCEYAFA